VAALPAGKEVTIALLRKEEDLTVTVTMAKRDDDMTARTEMNSFDGLGIKPADLTAERARQFGHDENSRGVIVLEVDPQGNAGKAGVKPGDIIMGINHTPLNGVTEYRDLTHQIEKGETVRLLIKRPNTGFIVAKIMKG